MSVNIHRAANTKVRVEEFPADKHSSAFVTVEIKSVNTEVCLFFNNIDEINAFIQKLHVGVDQLEERR